MSANNDDTQSVSSFPTNGSSVSLATVNTVTSTTNLLDNSSNKDAGASSQDPPTQAKSGGTSASTSNVRQPQKDYEASWARLASAYGFAPIAAGSINPKKSGKSKDKSKAKAKTKSGLTGTSGSNGG